MAQLPHCAEPGNELLDVCATTRRIRRWTISSATMNNGRASTSRACTSELGVLLGHDIGARDDGGEHSPPPECPQIAPESFIGALEQCWPEVLLLAGRSRQATDFTAAHRESAPRGASPRHTSSSWMLAARPNSNASRAPIR